MPAAILTPFTQSTAAPAGSTAAGLRKWVKRILPIGAIRYDGRILDFDRSYLEQLADAFRQRSHNQVPLQLAPDSNAHTNDVERFGGEIQDMAVQVDGPDGPGLYATLATTERGTRVIQDNPNLGVSARIIENHQRANDGKLFPAAIQHVLATLDPRVVGMGAWQAADLATDGSAIPTIDLSSLEFAPEGEGGPGSMPDLNDAQRARLAQLLDLPDNQWAQVLSAAAGDPGGQPTGGSQELSDEELAAMIAAMPEDEFAGLMGEFEQETAAAGAAGLSWDVVYAIEMANASSAEALRQLGQVNTELDEQRWAAEQRRLFDMGIPAPVLAKVEPLLKGSGHVVELSNGQAVDAGQLVREGLAEYAQMASLLDLSAETGSPFDEPDGNPAAAQQREDVIARFKSETGMGR